MSYARSAAVQKFVDNAQTKLIVYYLDGNVRTWHGRHNFKSGRPANDPRAVEIRRHDRYVAANAAAIKVAMLIDMATRAEIRRFKKGEWV